LARRRNKKPKIILPGMWFHEMTREEQEEYKRNNKPPGCQDCGESLILSNDNMRTWNCGECNEKKKPNGEGSEKLQVQA
jgi:ribosomal protein L37AE/L43A